METQAKPQIICPYDPLPWQRAPFRDKSPTQLYTGSAGGGKSRIAAEKIHGFCKKYPGTRALIIRKTKESLADSVIPLLQNFVIGDDPAVTYKIQERKFVYTNGSTIICRGMNHDKDAQRLRSVEADIIWIEEANALMEDDYSEVLRCLRGTAAHWRQIILTTNPDAPTHWINHRMIQGGEAKVYYSGAKDNKHNPPDYLDTLNRLTGVKRLRLVEGKWVQAEGAVYEEFDSSIHLVDAFEIPSHWRRLIAVDFGVNNPFVAQWWAIDHDGRAFMYREIYKTGGIVEDHAARMRALSANERISKLIADTEDKNGRLTIARHFMQTTGAKKGKDSITTGIQQVHSRLALSVDKLPRLFLVRGSLVEQDQTLVDAGKPTCTAEEFPAYRWPKGQDGKSLKEVPVDEDNHGMDALRYLVRYLDPIRKRFKRNVKDGRVA